MESPALEIIKKNGVGVLGGYDGCACAAFAVQHICVDVSCRKSSGFRVPWPDYCGIGVRVWSTSMDVGPDELEAVAREVARELSESFWSPVRVRYCTYEQDEKNACVYCGKSREKSDDYLCKACLVRTDPWGGSIAEQYDMKAREFTIEIEDA